MHSHPAKIVSPAASIYHQAILANIPVGYFLTRYFLPSSRRRIPIANVNGKKMCSTGTPYPISLIIAWNVRLTLVKKVFWKNGT